MKSIWEGWSNERQCFDSASMAGGKRCAIGWPLRLITPENEVQTLQAIEETARRIMPLIRERFPEWQCKAHEHSNDADTLICAYEMMRIPAEVLISLDIESQKEMACEESLVLA